MRDEIRAPSIVVRVTTDTAVGSLTLRTVTVVCDWLKTGGKTEGRPRDVLLAMVGGVSRETIVSRSPKRYMPAV